MKSGSEPQHSQAVGSGKVSKQFGAASAGHASNEEMLMELVSRLGGEHSVVEQLTAVLGSSAGPAGVLPGEDEDGYCYLKLFDSVEHRDAIEMGPRPTVAEVRRFSNGRADPFGLRTVTILVKRDSLGRLAHVSYNGGKDGLRPVEALASLSKDCRVGGLPDGVTEDFPASWIPAKLDAVQTWDYIRKGQTTRALDLLEWVGNEPPWADKSYEPISASTSRVRWTVRADPLGPATGTVDIIDPAGKVVSVRAWTSYVAHTGYHQAWKVRGNKVFAQATIWRAARVLSDPTSPAPQPTPGPGHGDLLVRATVGVKGHAPKAKAVRVIPTVTSDTPGFCYGKAFADEADAIWTLGAYPRVADVLRYYDTVVSRAESHGSGRGLFNKCRLTGGTFQHNGKPVHHAVLGGDDGINFWTSLFGLDGDDLIGATQADVVHAGSLENIASAPTLTVKPRGGGTLMSVPFVAVLRMGQEVLYWDVSAGKKFASLSSYFESVELVSLRAKVTVHRGDNDTLLTLVADSVEHPLSQDTDWIGAAHTLHVSGNLNGATSGELVLEGNHGFGTQLKGVNVGNPTPVIQAKLETSVSATAYLKFIVTVRVSGTGIPMAMVLPTRPAKGGANGKAVATAGGGDDSEEE